MIWTLTGLYMTVIHIDVIHGDHFIRPANAAPIAVSELVSPAKAASTISGARTVKLASLLGKPVYVVDSDGAQALVDARSGARTPPPSKRQIAEIATSRYSGEEKLVGLS